MTRYHLEYRVPREGEQFLYGLVRADGDPAINTVHADTMGGYSPHYVITEDRPKSDHPEALLVRADGDLWVRIEPLLGVAYYQRLYCLQDGDNLAPEDFAEWEDVYDEVPEPEPERPTADVIRIIEANLIDPLSETAPVLAIRQDSDSSDLFWYRTRGGSPVNPERITAWEDVVTNGDSK
jgi:hypothetical protein